MDDVGSLQPFSRRQLDELTTGFVWVAWWRSRVLLLRRLSASPGHLVGESICIDKDPCSHQMNRPSLPPRGIFIPTQMIFSSRLPPAILITWIQLRALAWDGWITPAMSLKEISKMLGKSHRTLLDHLSKLNQATGMTWQAAQNGCIIIRFPDHASNLLETRCVKSDSQEIPHAMREEDTGGSYFPAQILGYLTYNDIPDA